MLFSRLFSLTAATVTSSLVSHGQDVKPEVLIAGRTATFSSLNDALSAAKPGDSLEVSGTHKGNFIISKPLTISGKEEATLDGQGQGTILVIDADGVTVEALTITSSGTGTNPKAIWGDAGVRIDGSKTKLNKITISKCDWGVLSRGGDENEVSHSVIEHNRRDGIKLMGGEGHQLFKNQVRNNQVGIVVDNLFGDEKEMIMPSWTDMKVIQQLAKVMQEARPCTNSRIDGNTIQGNGSFGVQISSRSTGIEVTGNEVLLTGKETKPDIKAMSALATSLAISLRIPPEQVEMEMSRQLGTGILLACGPEKNRLFKNRCHGNLSYGIGLKVTHNNQIEENEISGNRIGIQIQSSNTNQLTANDISDSAEFGIQIKTSDAINPTIVQSDGNRLIGNSMVGNKVNAYDSSNRQISAEDLENEMDGASLPGLTNNPMMKDPAFRKKMLESMLRQQKPGKNHWNDGTRGNHYGDFDKHSEGFEDNDDDGIGDKPHAIPGDSATDQHPLASSPR